MLPVQYTYADFIQNFTSIKSIKSIVTIPASVTEIVKSAFAYSAITEVIFEENSNLQKIGENAFCGCKLLKSIKIPASVTVIDNAAFSNSGLEEITFEDGSNLKILGWEILSWSKIKTIEVPASIVTISNYAFSSTPLEKITFASNSKLENIQADAFDKCEFLRYVKLPSKGIRVDTDLFFKSNLNEIIYDDDSPSQTREKNEYFVQLCRENDIRKCEEYLHNNNISAVFKTQTHSSNFALTSNYETALEIAISTKDSDLCTLLVKYKARRGVYRNDYMTCLVAGKEEIFQYLFDQPFELVNVVDTALRVKDRDLATKLLRKLKHNFSLGIWDKPKKKLFNDSTLENILGTNSMEIFQLALDCGLCIEYATLQQFWKRRNVENISEAVVNSFLSTSFLQLSHKDLEDCFYTALRIGSVDIIQRILQTLTLNNDNESFSVNLSQQLVEECKPLLFLIPHSKLDMIIPILLPYITTTPDLIKEADYDECRKFHPETVLSYLAFTKSFEAFKAVIESSTTSFQPTHLVACSLFRGYFTSRFYKHSVDVYDEIFDYLMHDDIRPRVLGLDSEWIDKSIYICIRYASERMTLKLLDLGADLSNIFVHQNDGRECVVLSRYTLLSYACRYQGVSLVKELIKRGIPVNGTMIDILNESVLPGTITNSGIITKDNILNYDMDVEKEGLGREDIEDVCIDTDIDIDDEDEDEDEDKNSVKNKNVTRHIRFIYRNGVRKVINRKPWFLPYFCRKTLNKNKDFPDEIDIDQLGSLRLFNMTPLAAAISHKKVEIVQLLLQYGANPNSYAPMHFPTIYNLHPIISSDLLRKSCPCEDSDNEVINDYGIQDKRINNKSTDDGLEIEDEVLASLKLGTFQDQEIKPTLREQGYDQSYEKNLVCQVHYSQPHKVNITAATTAAAATAATATTTTMTTTSTTTKTKTKTIKTADGARKKQKIYSLEANANIDVELPIGSVDVGDKTPNNNDNNIDNHNDNDKDKIHNMCSDIRSSIPLNIPSNICPDMIQSKDDSKDSRNSKNSTNQHQTHHAYLSPTSRIYAALLEYGLCIKLLLRIQYIFKFGDSNIIFNLESLVTTSSYAAVILSSLQGFYSVKKIKNYIYQFLNNTHTGDNLYRYSITAKKDYTANLISLQQYGLLNMIKEDQKKLKNRKKLDKDSLYKFVYSNPSAFLALVHFGVISKRDKVTLSDVFFDATLRLSALNFHTFFKLTKLLPHIFKLTMKNSVGVSLMMKDDLYSRYALFHLGLNVDHRIRNGDTLLLHCIKSRLETTSMMLLALGADVYLRDKDGKSCYDVLKKLKIQENMTIVFIKHRLLLSIFTKMNEYQDKLCVCPSLDVDVDVDVDVEIDVDVDNSDVGEHTEMSDKIKEVTHPLTKYERILLQSSMISGYTAQTLSYFLSRRIVDTLKCMYCNMIFKNNDHCRPMLSRIPDSPGHDTKVNFSHNHCFHKNGLGPSGNFWGSFRQRNYLSCVDTIHYIVNPTKKNRTRRQLQSIMQCGK